MFVPANLVYVQMKTRRANMHLDALESAIRTWLERPPYTISTWDDLKKWHYCQIDMHSVTEDIPILVGDYVCCLRSALDQLAWALAHLDSTRIRSLKPGQLKRLGFPISIPGDTNYSERRGFFPPAVADVFDTLQPYRRRESYRDDPLWQLDELWRLDKHIMIPANCTNVKVEFPVTDVEWLGYTYSHIKVRIPMAIAWLSPAHVKPRITTEIFFGEYSAP